MKKPIHIITVDFDLDPGLAFMRHITNELMTEKLRTVRKEQIGRAHV